MLLANVVCPMPLNNKKLNRNDPSEINIHSFREYTVKPRFTTERGEPSVKPVVHGMQNATCVFGFRVIFTSTQNLIGRMHNKQFEYEIFILVERRTVREYTFAKKCSL